MGFIAYTLLTICFTLGLVPPGYKYLGPGNSLDQGEPTNPSDAAAKEHDEAYDTYLKSGKNPYLYFSAADQRFIDQTKDAKDWGGRIGHYFFRAKRAIAPKLTEQTEQPGPSPRTRPGKRQKPPSHIFVNLARKKKKKKTNKGPGQTSTDRTVPMSDGGAQPDGSAESAVRTERSTGSGGGSGGGGGGGSGGVGISTGTFNNQTEFKFLEDGWVEITAHASRLVHLNMPESETYKRVVVNNLNETGTKGNMVLDDAHAQIVTPWALVDSNAWGVWFNPGDWQLITNTMTELHLISFEQDIFNVVLKTVTESATTPPTKVYNNDLTASLMVALDSNNSLPFTPAAMRSETLGFYPWKPTVPTPWRYYFAWDRELLPTFTDSTGTVTNVMHGVDPDDAQFFTIENTVPIHLLRTGDEFSTGPFYFNCKPCRLTHTWQTNRALGLPPYLNSLPATEGDSHTGDIGVQQDKRKGVTQIAATNYVTETTIMRPAEVGYSAPWYSFESGTQGPFHTPIASGRGGPNNKETVGADGDPRYFYGKQRGQKENDTGDTPARFTYYPNTDTGRYPPGEWLQGSRVGNDDFPVPLTNGYGLLPTNQIGGKENMNYTNVLNTYGPLTALNNIPPIYPNGQIWDKEFDTDLKPRMHINAPFACTSTCPGQLFVKVAPNLTNEYDPDNLTMSRIVTYSDFWWKGKLVFKAKMRAAHTWNPVQRMSISTGNVFNYIPSNQGAMTIYPEHSQLVPRKLY